VTLNGGAPGGGAVVQLSTLSPAVTLPTPATATISSGQASGTFTITANSVSNSTSADVTASYNGSDQHASLIVVNFAVQRISPWEPHLGANRGPLLLASLSPEIGEASSGTSMLRWSTYSSTGFHVKLGLEGETERRSDGIDPLEKRMPVVLAGNPPGPTKRNFIYSPEMNLLAESELSQPREKAIIYEYIWFNGHPVAQVDGGTITHWTFTDHLGTPLIQTTANQTVSWRAEYEPYGKVFAYNPASLADQHQPLRLPGQEAEQLNLGQNGLTERSYNTFRWYRSAWGRYTQSDPANAGLSESLSYSNLNPLRFRDPLGLWVMKDLIVTTKTYDREMSMCPPNNGGACTIGYSGSISCDCNDCPPVSASVTFYLRGHIFAYGGPFSLLRRKPRDRSVRDYDSAVAHERHFHLDHGVDAIRGLLDSLESETFQSHAECDNACAMTNIAVQRIFARQVALSQEGELLMRPF
jgi:RHS repeat-associated protein